MVTWGPPTVFGGAAATATAPTSAFSFASPQAPTTSTAFGTPTPSLFSTPTHGANTAHAGSTPAATASAYAGYAPAPANLFGAAPAPAVTTPQQAALWHARRQAQQQQEVARLEASLTRLLAAYGSNGANAAAHAAVDPNSVPLQHVFFDPNYTGGAAAAYAPRPTHVPPPAWAAALAARHADTVPVSLVGAEALSDRISRQQERADALRGVVVQLGETLRTVDTEDDRRQLAYHTQEHARVQRRTLEIMRKVELLRCRHLALQPAERDLGGKLAAVVHDVARLSHRVREVEGALGELVATARSRRQTQREPRTPLTPQDKDRLFRILEEQRDGLARLVDMVKTDVRDAAIVKRLIEESRTNRQEAWMR